MLTDKMVAGVVHGLPGHNFKRTLVIWWLLTLRLKLSLNTVVQLFDVLMLYTNEMMLMFNGPQVCCWGLVILIYLISPVKLHYF